jgi:hypothetical protein
MMTRSAAVFCCFALAGALAVLPSEARADDAGAPAQAPSQAVTADVLMLHGTNDGSGIDPKIGKMSELGAPPFSSYNSYKQLDRATLSLTKGAATTTKLPNGRVLMVTLKEVTPPKKKDEPKKYTISTSIESPAGGKVFLPLVEVNTTPGSWIVLAGQSYKGGMLAIGIKIVE